MRVLRWKPSQGWRQFLGQVATIGLGVLMASGMEQLIVSSNARQEAVEARKAIRHEVASNLGYLSNRLRTGSCIKNRLLEVETYIDAASNGYVDVPPHWIGRPQVWNMDTPRWQSASALGRTSLFSLQEQSQFSDIYGSFQAVEDAEQLEQIMWAQLRSLEGQHHLSETTASSMRSVLSQARYSDWRISLGFAQARKKADGLGIAMISDPTLRGSNSVCVPISTPREIAIKQSGSPYGEP
jgi:hypothetical protein